MFLPSVELTLSVVAAAAHGTPAPAGVGENPRSIVRRTITISRCSRFTLDADAPDGQLATVPRLTGRYRVVYRALAHAPAPTVTRAAAS